MQDETGVAVAHWECEALRDAIATVRAGVDGFAHRHGMARPTRQDVGAAVSEAVAVAMGPLLPAPGRVVVDAATDGACLSVRVAGGAEHESGEAIPMPLVVRLADRVEYGPRFTGAGTTILMEFAIPERDPAVRRRGERCGARTRPAARGHTRRGA
ncbi:MAG TPA: hypothetical protein VGW10_03245 [Solirubrobacteraceae bacterium]|nr:hypothetical protein [Solirubrobacteraceae bacterium]